MREERGHSWKGEDRMTKVQMLEEEWQVQGTSRCEMKKGHELSWTNLLKAGVW